MHTSHSRQLAAGPTWVIHDGAPGNRRQAMALAEALERPAIEWSLSAHGLARWLAPRKFVSPAASFGMAFAETLAHAPPVLAIGCGRQAALATRFCREAGAKTVQILNPRLSINHWDIVIAPEHDQLTGDNVITLRGSLHPVNAAWLQQAREQFPELAQLPKPRTAVLIGGPTRATPFDLNALNVLLEKLDHTLATQGGSFLLCGSARTPENMRLALRAHYRNSTSMLWLDDHDGRNPYAGALAWADRIIVSPDSVNMISEACACPVPVFIAETERATGRVQRFIAALQAQGRVQAQTRDLVPFNSTALLETARVAALAAARLGL